MGVSKYGINGRLYYNSGSYGSPVWNAINDIGDVNNTDETEAVDETTRANGGYKSYGGALTDLGWEFTLKKKTSTQAALTALRNAKINRTAIEILDLDGDIGTTGSEGFRCSCRVFGFNRNQKMNSPIGFDVSLKPCESDNPPSWYTV